MVMSSFVYNRFMINDHKGLGQQEAKDLLAKFGLNKLPETPPRAGWLLLVDQFKSPLIIILLVATIVTIFLGDFIDTWVILLAVFINTILGFFQEYKADRTLHALKQLLVPRARVMRDGLLQIISVSELVPGDLVELTAGDKVPADGVVVEARRLQVNEAMLTGESQPVEKTAESVLASRQLGMTPGEKVLYMGTVVVAGHGQMRVATTGKRTRIGKIAMSLGTTITEITPLQQQLNSLARVITWVVIAVSIAVFAFGVAMGFSSREMFSTAVAVAVAAIPEGMVVALTVVLAIGMQRIFTRRAIVRRLVAAETLGAVNTICVDKTGTITQGMMRVAKSALLDRRLASEIAVMVNNLEDTLETALWDWGQAAGRIDAQKLREENPRLDELPFDSRDKYMAVLTPGQIWVKGAPEAVLAFANITSSERQLWLAKVEVMGKLGLKVLALAHGKISKSEQKLPAHITGLTIAGLVGIADPVRAGVKLAFEVCQRAGISVKVITGDYRHTAEAVMHAVGLPIKNPQQEVLEGEELTHMSEFELRTKISEARLFCRVSPEQKLKIVSVLAESGAVVAMTGDGVNDSLALKRAAIGIVVKDASDVARETADMVLLNSDFATIVAAVEEGRGIFVNIRKVVMYLLAGTFAEVVAIVSSLAAGLPLPLTPVQILWVNLVTDGLPSLGLTVDPKDTRLMQRPPRSASEGIVNSTVWGLVIGVSLLVGLVTTASFGFIYKVTGSLEYARTVGFSVVSISSLLYVFSLRLGSRALWHTNFLHNRYLIGAVIMGFILQIGAIYLPGAERLFATVAVRPNDWWLILGASLVPTIGIESLKWVRRRL